MTRRALLLAVLALLALPGAASATVPANWIGVVADGELFHEPKLLGPEIGQMRKAGVGAIRTAVWWNLTVRCRGCRPDFRSFDRVVLDAARRRIDVLPDVLSAPPHLALSRRTFIGSPRRPADLAAFMRVLVRRYGPRGAFWRQHRELPARPIRQWQIWNEPDHEMYLPGVRNRPRRYVELLKAAARAVRQIDPEATIVLAGLTGRSWDWLSSIYAAGGRPWFDVVALHPYTKKADDVVRVVRYVRATMAARDDPAKPIVITETGWTASRGARRARQPSWCSFCLRPGPASRSLHRLLPLLAEHREELNIVGVYVYTWLSSYRQGDPFDYAGLRRLTPRGKVVNTPFYSAFRRALSMPVLRRG